MVIEEIKKNKEVTQAALAMGGTLIGYFIAKDKGDGAVGSIIGGFVGTLIGKYLTK